MLLLVVDAPCHYLVQFFPVAARRYPLCDVLIKISAIGADHAGSDRFIIAIENVIVLWIEYPIVFPFREQKGFVKPCRMSEMPLWGTDIHNRLNNVVLLGKRSTYVFGLLPNLLISTQPTVHNLC